MTCLGRTIAPSWTPGAVQPALDKTENSITVLGRKVQKNRRIGNAGGNPAGIRPGLHREYSAGPRTSSKFTAIPKTFKHPLLCTLQTPCLAVRLHLSDASERLQFYHR